MCCRPTPAWPSWMPGLPCWLTCWQAAPPTPWIDMAYLFPATPAGELPPHVLRVFNFFKNLPESFIIWHHLAPWQPQAPDFLVLYQQKRALLVKVSPAAAAEA